MTRREFYTQRLAVLSKPGRVYRESEVKERRVIRRFLGNNFPILDEPVPAHWPDPNDDPASLRTCRYCNVDNVPHYPNTRKCSNAGYVLCLPRFTKAKHP